MPGLRKNLDSYPIQQPLSCERPINPEFKDFGKPDWKSLDAAKHIDLIRQMDKLLFYRFKSESFDEAKWLERTQKQIARGLLRLSIAQLDVGTVGAPNYGVNDQPDGIPDHVLRYEHGGQPCDPASLRDSNFLGVDYFVVNDGMTKVKEFHARGRHVFLYKGKVYFDSFSIAYTQDPDFGDPSKSAHLLPGKRFEIFVQEPYGGGAVTICRFCYVN